MLDFHCRTDVNLAGFTYQGTIRSDVGAAWLRKHRKLNSSQRFMFTQAVHTSLLILFTYD